MLPSPLFGTTRARHRIALVLAVAVLLAGIVQATHLHKDDLTGGNGDKHCLVCLYAAGNAAPPTPMQLVRPMALPLRVALRPSKLPCPHSLAPAPYDARGPPAV